MWLFNSAYGENYTLVDSALSCKFSANGEDSLFIQWCSERIPKDILNSMLNKEAKAFKWDNNKLRNTTVVSDSVARASDKNYLSITAPIFDKTKHYALFYETYDAGSCIHSGPVLYQYKNGKWTIIESRITIYHVMRGKSVPRDSFLRGQ